MRNFVLGMVAAVVVVALAGFLYVRLGFVDPRANIPVNSLEKAVAMPSLDACVDRHAPHIKNPVSMNDATLIAGMKIYQNNCASCHGDVNNPHGTFADALYPRPPQFAEDAPDMPEYQNFYIIQNGVRLSGMPAWSQSLSDEEMWQVTTFLAHMDKLPAAVLEQWKAETSGLAAHSSRDSSTMEKHGRMN